MKEKRGVLYSAPCPTCYEGTVLLTRTDVLATSELSELTAGILEEVAAEYGLTVGDLTGRRRFKRLTEPRCRAMFQMRTGLDMTLESIGLVFGGRDHSSIIYGLAQINAAGEYRQRDGRPVAVE